MNASKPEKHAKLLSLKINKKVSAQNFNVNW